VICRFCATALSDIRDMRDTAANHAAVRPSRHGAADGDSLRVASDDEPPPISAAALLSDVVARGDGGRRAAMTPEAKT